MGKFDDFMDALVRLIPIVNVKGVVAGIGICLVLIFIGFSVIDSYESAKVCDSKIPGSYYHKVTDTAYNCCVEEVRPGDNGYTAQTVCKGFKRSGGGIK